ncbi:Ig-like domain repeat protein [Telmatobacter bradus]|uniref:Ig-like domain repeat protein n=1 Tax=Telmatobacter bradus TaxID=474953 RepID=UPI003B42DADB
MPASPYLNCEVTTTGIVIAVLTDGFYIENASGWDSNTCSSEGIYVYTGSTTPTSLGIVPQQSVTVTGLVEASNSSVYAGIQIYIASPVVGSSGNIVINSTGNALPSTVGSSTLTAATDGTCTDYGDDSFGQWLPFEGMRVNIPSSSTLLVTQGTGGTVTPSAQTAVTNGQFWAVLTTTRPMRSAGMNILDPVHATAIADKSTIETWNGNPQLLFVDSTALGGTALDASATTEYTGSDNLIGIVDYHLSSAGYTGLLLTSASVSALAAETTGASPTVATTRGSSEVTIATQDLNSLTAAETNRITKLAYAVVDYLKSPDILAVQGATDGALNALISAISTAGGPSYTLAGESTADSSSLLNAFLVNASMFDGTPTASQILASDTYTSTSSTTSDLFARSPLLLTASIARSSSSDYAMNIVNTTLLARSGLSATSTTTDTQLQREQQAEALAAYVASLQTAGDNVMVLGGFDSFEFADGYVDTLGILDGLEASNTDDGAYVWTYYGSSASSLVDTTTTSPNLTATAAAGTSTVTPTTSRYTYVENGSAEQPDHILISSGMSSLTSIDYARFGADFPDSLTYTTSTSSTASMVERASTHDGVVAYVTIPYATSQTLSCSPTLAESGTSVYCTDLVTSSYTGSKVSGTITYYDGSTALGTATVTSGSASFTLSSLAVGVHTITAQFATNNPFQASTSNTQTVTILSTFALSLSPTSKTLYTGETATYTLTVTPGTGFTLDVALICSGVPDNASCTVSPATVTGGSGTATITILTKAPHQETTTAKLERGGLERGRLERGGGGVFLAGLLLFLLPRRKRASWLALLLVGFLLTALTACNQAGSLTGGTPAGSYTITVTGTASSGSITITETATTVLTVKSLF